MRAFGPGVVLIDRVCMRRQISGNGMTATLKPGPYWLEISSERPQRLSFNVLDGAGRHEIAASATPGWFTAQMGSGEGSLIRFKDAGGELFSIEVPEIGHSLPSGDYFRTYLLDDGREIARRFEIDVRRGVMPADS